MSRFTKTLLTATALCAAATFSPAQAELDVIKLKAAVETSVEVDYPNSTRSTRISTPIRKSPSRK